jgi:hypothetical protein
MNRDGHFQQPGRDNGARICDTLAKKVRHGSDFIVRQFESRPANRSIRRQAHDDGPQSSDPPTHIWVKKTQGPPQASGSLFARKA